MSRIPTSLRFALPVLLLASFLTPASAQSIGAETCAGCHDELADAFRDDPHARVDPEGHCEACHGPGEAHAGEGDPSAIRRFGDGEGTVRASPICLECHGRDKGRRDWPVGYHASAGLDCTNCHVVHEGERTGEEDTFVCYECHGGVESQFTLTERHPVGRAGFSCSDCHDPHGRSLRGRLGGFKQAPCFRCHTEYRGPWMFEHEAVAVEGCMACHAPHGSVNRHLLTYQRVGDLCIQCHPEQPFFHVATDVNGQRTTAINDCTRCHVQIHGSNNDALFLN